MGAKDSETITKLSGKIWISWAGNCYVIKKQSPDLKLADAASVAHKRLNKVKKCGLARLKSKCEELQQWITKENTFNILFWVFYLWACARKMVFLSLIPANPVCVLWRQLEGKWKSIWVAGRAMHHSCFLKKCFTQRSLKKVVSDLTAWTSFRNAGTGWKLKLGEWVCSWLCFFYFCRMTGIPACYLGSAQSKEVKDSIRGWVLAKLSGTLGCDVVLLAVFWFIPDFSQVLDLYLSSTLIF